MYNSIEGSELVRIGREFFHLLYAGEVGHKNRLGTWTCCCGVLCSLRVSGMEHNLVAVLDKTLSGERAKAVR
jgi:hypothetical protein